MILLVYGLSLLIYVLGVPTTSSCPRSCSCAFGQSTIELKCNSFDFLRNDELKKSNIIKLTITNANISEIDKDVKNLNNLIYLSLAKNQIKTLSSHLPSSLKYLDVSFNRITNIPQDFELLTLKEIKINGNPISCSCNSLSIRDSLLDSGIKIEDVLCDSPKSLKGKSYLSAHCDSLFGMQNDEAVPYEGSGFEEDNTLTTPIHDDDGIIEDEFMKQPIVQLTTKRTELNEIDEEGSGDEYDDKNDTQIVNETIQIKDVPPLERTFVKPCNFNCSTPTPLNSSNDTNTSPTPGFFEGIGIIVSDLDIITDKETTPKPTPTPTPTPPNASNDVDIVENKIRNSSIVDDEQINPTFVFLGILVLLMICFIIYAIIKRRTSRRMQLDRDDIVEEEMMPIKLKNEEKTNGIKETDPLMNGHDDHNGKVVESKNSLIVPNDRNDNRPNVLLNSTNSLGGNDEFDKKINENLLTPETTRVTIRAAEIPDSIPKTPILVNRRVNSDGTIITTRNEE